MESLADNPGASDEDKQARRKVLREYWRLIVGAALVAAALAVLIVALLEHTRIDYSGPLGGIGGRFAELSDGRIVAARRWEPENFPDGAALRGEFYFAVRGEWHGGGFFLPQTSFHYTSAKLTITEWTPPFSRRTLADTQIPADSPYRGAVEDLIRREGSEIVQRAWFDGVPFADRQYFSAFFDVFSRCLLLCFIALSAPAIIKAVRRMSRVSEGQCLECGYDLRAAAKEKTQCPECGAEVVKTHRRIGDEPRRSTTDG